MSDLGARNTDSTYTKGPNSNAKHDGNGRGWITWAVAAAGAIVLAIVLFFALGGDADVDVEPGGVDVDVEPGSVDADVDAPEVDVDAPDVDVDVDPGSVDVDDADAEADAGD